MIKLLLKTYTSLLIIITLSLNALAISPSKPKNPINLNCKLILTSPDSGKIVYLSLKDLSMIYSYSIKGEPYEITSLKDSVYITDFAKDKIYKFKFFENTIVNFNTIDLPLKSHPIQIKSFSDKIHVLNFLSNNLSTYHSENLLFSTNTILNPTDFTYFEKTNKIGIISPSINKLLILNENNLAKRKIINIYGSPEKIISSTDGEHAYVTLRNKKSILKFNYKLEKEVKEIAVGDTPVSLAESSDGRFLYVANGKSNNISIIDLSKDKVTDTIDLPIEIQFPGEISLTPDNKWLIVPSETTSKITFIDLNNKSIVLNLDVGITTHGICIIEN